MSLPPSPLSPAELADGLARLLVGIGSMDDLSADLIRDTLGVPVEPTGKGGCRYLAQLTPLWHYQLRWDPEHLIGPLLYFSLSDTEGLEAAPVGELSGLTLEPLAAALVGGGYQRETSWGEHGQVLEHWFRRGPLLVQVAGRLESTAQPGREYVTAIRAKERRAG